VTRENGSKENSAGDQFGNDSGNDSRNPLWRNGVMTEPTITEPHRALQSLVDHVAVLARGPEGTRLAARIAGPMPRGKDAPNLVALLARRDADGRPAIRIQERLAKEAPYDPLAALALLVMLRPELEAVRDRLVHSGLVSPLEAETDTVAAAWEVVTRRPPPGRWERCDTIWGLARRDSGLRRKCSIVTEPLPVHFDGALYNTALDDSAFDDGSDVATEGIGRSPALLAAAVAAGVLTPRQVVLIARTRLEGRPLGEVAQALGRPYDAARMERRRAEVALRPFVVRYESESGS